MPPPPPPPPPPKKKKKKKKNSYKICCLLMLPVWASPEFGIRLWFEPHGWPPINYHATNSIR